MLHHLCLLGLATSTSLLAERKNFLPDFDDGRISLYIENDIFAGTDRDYTNGGRLAWISGARKKLPEIAPIQRHLDQFAGTAESFDFFQDIWGFKNTEEVSYQYGMALTQLIFTPNSTDAIPPPGQRPYAGWLGLGFSLHVSDETAINSVELTLGTVGRNALAEEAQDFIHDLRDIPKFNGWDRQIPSEATLNINFNQKRRYSYLQPDDLNLLPLSLNGFTNLGFSLGNYRTALDVGWHFQFGYNVPIDFSDPRLTPTSNSISWNGDAALPKFSAYLIAGARGSVVLHDITLDGPVFKDFDTQVDREPFVGEIYTGFGMRYKDVEFSYVQTIRTKEYKQQEDHQKFGSLAVRFHY